MTHIAVADYYNLFIIRSSNQETDKRELKLYD
jgi:hypothetical protein